MNDAVEFGTARRAGYDTDQTDLWQDRHLFGHAHADAPGLVRVVQRGWRDRKLVVAVLLTGGHVVNGPKASGVAGQVYKILNDENYFASQEAASDQTSALGTIGCCQ